VVVGKIMGKDSDDTSEHGERFKCGRRIVYKQRLLGLDNFLFFCLYSFSCIAKQVMTLK